jgi:Tfp pilus assembly protein PilP
MRRLPLIALIVAVAWTAVSASQAVPLQPGAAASAPRPPAPIAAAKDVAGKVEAAQQKNAEALDPKPGTTPPPAAAPSAPAPAPAPAANVPAGAAPAQAGQQPAAAPAPAGSAYSYDPSGRRDPFVSLLMRGNDTRPAGATRPPGLPGQLVGELTLKGVLKSKSGFVAILQASDNKTYLGRPGDRVMDGSIKSIAQDAVVFSQDVNDPLSLVKQREVRKAIRPETK